MGRSSEVKDRKKTKKVKCDRQTYGRTDRLTRDLKRFIPEIAHIDTYASYAVNSLLNGLFTHPRDKLKV